VTLECRKTKNLIQNTYTQGDDDFGINPLRKFVKNENITWMTCTKKSLFSFTAFNIASMSSFEGDLNNEDDDSEGDDDSESFSVSNDPKDPIDPNWSRDLPPSRSPCIRSERAVA
jgi:hypothetical protein